MKLIRIVLLGILLAGLVPFQTLPVHSSPGTLLVPSQYSTIQSAVDAAVTGDTILVAAGSYAESVAVTKSVSLVGESRDTTIIDASASGPGINITGTSGVLVSGFRIQDTGFYDAIVVSSSSNVTIYQNRVQASLNVFGIFVSNSNGVHVIGNDLTGNFHGVRIQAGASNLVQGNNVTANTIGVSVFLSKGNKIVDNLLRLGEQGILLGGESEATVVARNSIANNTVFGIFLRDSRGHLIVYNRIENTTTTGPIPAEGIHVQNSTRNIIHHNSLRNNDFQIFAVRPPDDITLNTWDDGSQGNYWSDYAGVDDGSGGRSAGDGVGDTLIPHPCPNGGLPCQSSVTPVTPGVDNFPLIDPVVLASWNATAIATPSSGLALLTVSFNGLAIGGTSPYTYSWSFGDGSTAEGQTVSHTYTSRGTYFAKLNVTDNVGTWRSDYVAILVTETTGDIAVRVRDENDAPIVGARVRSLFQPVGQAGFDSQTNDQGVAAFSGLKPGTYTVEASSPGFLTATVNVTLTSNEIVNRSIVLSRPRAADYTLWLVAGLAGATVAGVVLFWFRRNRRTAKARA